MGVLIFDGIVGFQDPIHLAPVLEFLRVSATKAQSVVYCRSLAVNSWDVFGQQKHPTGWVFVYCLFSDELNEGFGVILQRLAVNVVTVEAQIISHLAPNE